MAKKRKNLRRITPEEAGCASTTSTRKMRARIAEREAREQEQSRKSA